MKKQASPDLVVYKQTIHFEKKSEIAVYIQIAQQVIILIQQGKLKPGNSLPGTRILSKELQINRNTVVAVYEELASQGWVEIIPNKGTFILDPNKSKNRIKALDRLSSEKRKVSDFTNYEFQSSFNLATIAEHFEGKHIINEGKPDIRLHPTHQFSKWYSATMKRKNIVSKWSQENFSHTNFDKQLCNYLNVTRNFVIKPHNILSTRSSEMSLYIVSQLLLKENDIVVTGSLSNYTANMILQQAGATIKTLPVDENGLQIELLPKILKQTTIRCLYINTNRHYPTTVKLSNARREKLLKLAKEHHFAIIEDDFDYDFQYDDQNTQPLFSNDENGSVIYLGKLGQSFLPSFQSGYIIAPKNLIDEAKNYLQLLDKQGDLIQKQIFSELIEEGEIYRFIKKNIHVYKKRLDQLCKSLNEYFGDLVKWKKPSGGLAIWLEFNQTISLTKLAQKCREENLFLPKTILYQDKNNCAIRFGFGHLNEEEIKMVVKKMRDAYEELI